MTKKQDSYPSYFGSALILFHTSDHSGSLILEDDQSNSEGSYEHGLSSTTHSTLELTTQYLNLILLPLFECSVKAGLHHAYSKD